MQTTKNQSFIRRLRFAWAGIAHAVRAEHSLRFHLSAVVVVLIVLAVFRPEPVWWAIVTLTCAAVVSAELFNTAIEHLADHLHPEIHPSIRIVKDCAAAAVLVTSLAALGVAAALIVHLAERGP
jgi:diacylglycerol kinase (ATP)